MADTFLEEVGKYLGAQGVGTYGLDSGTGWGIYIYNHPAKIGKVVLLTPSQAPPDPEIPMTTWNIQVLFKSKSGKEIVDQAKVVYDLLHRQENVTLVTMIVDRFTARTTPAYLGIDDNERPMVAIEFEALVHGQVV